MDLDTSLQQQQPNQQQQRKQQQQHPPDSYALDNTDRCARCTRMDRTCHISLDPKKKNCLECRTDPCEIPPVRARQLVTRSISGISEAIAILAELEKEDRIKVHAGQQDDPEREGDGREVTTTEITTADVIGKLQETLSTMTGALMDRIDGASWYTKPGSTRKRVKFNQKEKDDNTNNSL